MNFDDLITVARAAKLVSLSRRYLYDAIAAGNLTCTEIDGRIFLSRSQILGQWRKPVGRPKTKK